MLLHSKIQYIFLAFAAIIFFSAIAYVGYERGAFMGNIDACRNSDWGTAQQIDCWHEIIRDTFDAHDTREAFKVFEIIYNRYDTFAQTGCHRHAHRVGDMAYYFDYLTHKDLALVEFPKGATACGYGFYHGFVEHLIQDNPEPGFVTSACKELKGSLENSVAPAISQTCYHGAGHGFLLARVDELTQASQWSIRAFTEKPLEQCEALPEASEHEIAECRQGVYNVMTDWMSDGEYGLSYNNNEPFAWCDRERHERQIDCYYEVSQKLDSASGFDPNTMVRMIERAPRTDLAEIAMTVGVAGLVQHDPQGSQEELIYACQDITRIGLRNSCLNGLLGGLVEHTVPGSEYRNAIAFCESKLLTGEQTSLCYRSLLRKLRRFQTDDELNGKCRLGTLPSELCKLLGE